MRASERGLLRGWVRLGVMWNVPPDSRLPDVEKLIVASTSLVPENPRVLVLMASWLSIYWRCVGRDRLKVLALKTSPEQQATLGLLLQTVDAWLTSRVFTGLCAELARVKPVMPLLQVDRARPALHHLIQIEASEISKNWGLLALPIERKDDAIRPAAYVLKQSPSLRTRSLFKGALKTSLLSEMAAVGREVPVSALARSCGVTRKAVYEALEDLEFSGTLARQVRQAVEHG